MPILCHDPKCVERRCRPQDRTNIVRVRHLIQHQQWPTIVGPAIEQFAQPDVLKRFDFCNEPLVRRIGRHHPSKVSSIGIGDRQDGRQIQCAQGFTGPPDLAHHPVRVGQRRNHRVPPPETGPVSLRRRLPMTSAHEDASLPKTPSLARGLSRLGFTSLIGRS